MVQGSGGAGPRGPVLPMVLSITVLAAVPLGTVVVPGDSDLELCRAHIERLQQVRLEDGSPPPAARPLLPTQPPSASQQEPEGAGANSPACQKLSPKWCFLDGEWPRLAPSLGGAAGHLDKGLICPQPATSLCPQPPLPAAFTGLTGLR